MSKDIILHNIRDWSKIDERESFWGKVDLLTPNTNFGIHRYSSALWTSGQVGVGRLFDREGMPIQDNGKDHVLVVTSSYDLNPWLMLESVLLDDEYEDYRPIVRKIENPAACAVREKTVLEEEQLKKLLDYLVEKKHYDKACMLAMCMNNGRRKAELPRMKVSYFTEDNVIYGSLYKSPEQVQTKGRGSRGKQLTVYTLRNGFKKYLDLWLQYREEHNITSEWLIPKKENGIYIDEPIPTTTLDSWADTFSNFLGVPFYWHSLRHYFTTECSRSGLPDDVIQMLVGWSSLDMVSIYKDIEADEQFEKYFSEDGIKKVEQKSLADI